MELGKPESFRALDQHDGGIGHIDTHLDHSRGHQDVQLARREVAVVVFPFASPQLQEEFSGARSSGGWGEV